ncbi:MAG TPA: YqjK-like family protein [Burkholderiales bacterium]|nr:YqjK-like family protein [Burkholderiales bacterium]
MNPRRLAQIQARRERLIAKAAAQREEVALLLAPWQAPLAIADKGVAVVAYVRGHPEIVLVAVAAFVVLSPKRAFRWARRAFAAWRGYRWAVNALHRALP